MCQKPKVDGQKLSTVCSPFNAAWKDAKVTLVSFQNSFFTYTIICSSRGQVFGVTTMLGALLAILGLSPYALGKPIYIMKPTICWPQGNPRAQTDKPLSLFRSPCPVKRGTSLVPTNVMMGTLTLCVQPKVSPTQPSPLILAGQWI